MILKSCSTLYPKTTATASALSALTSLPRNISDTVDDDIFAHFAINSREIFLPSATASIICWCADKPKRFSSTTLERVGFGFAVLSILPNSCN